MLGRLRMDIDECIEKYPAMAANVFGHPRTFHWRGVLRYKHDHGYLEQEITRLVESRTPESQTSDGTQHFTLYRSPPDLCRT